MEVESSWKLTVAVMINYIRRALWPYCLSRKRVCWTELAFRDLPLMTVFLDSEQSAQLFYYYSNLCLLYILRPERPLFQDEVEFHFGRVRWVGWLKEKTQNHHESNIKNPHESSIKNPHESNLKNPHESCIKNSHENSIKNSHESSIKNSHESSMNN